MNKKVYLIYLCPSPNHVLPKRGQWSCEQPLSISGWLVQASGRRWWMNIRQADKQMHRQIHRQMNRQMHREKGRPTQIDWWADRHTDTQTDRQTQRQIDVILWRTILGPISLIESVHIPHLINYASCWDHMPSCNTPHHPPPLSSLSFQPPSQPLSELFLKPCYPFCTCLLVGVGWGCRGDYQCSAALKKSVSVYIGNVLTFTLLWLLTFYHA